ncbi:hypothetical protein COP2_032202 [Malus domestica]
MNLGLPNVDSYRPTHQPMSPIIRPKSELKTTNRFAFSPKASPVLARRPINWTLWTPPITQLPFHTSLHANGHVHRITAGSRRVDAVGGVPLRYIFESLFDVV